MADSLVTLTAPNGSTVKVSSERSKALLEQGYSKPDAKSTSKSSPSAKK